MPAPIGYPIFRGWTPEGLPGAGYLLYSFVATSDTPQPTYTDASLTAENTNPTVLDANGEAPIWLDDLLYKLVLHDENDVPVWSIDSVSGAGGGSGSVGPQGPPGPAGPQGVPGSASGSSGQWAVFATNPAYVSATSFTVAGDYTGTFAPGTRVRSTNTAGTSYGQVVSSAIAGSNTLVTLVNTSGALDSGLSTVATGIITATNNALPILTKLALTLSTKAATFGGSNTWIGIASVIGDALAEVTTGASGVFTARQAGNYHFGGTVTIASDATTAFTGDDFHIDLFKASSSAQQFVVSWPFDNSLSRTYAVPISGVLALAAGDAVSLRFAMTFSGTAPQVTTGVIEVLRLN